MANEIERYNAVKAGAIPKRVRGDQRDGEGREADDLTRRIARLLHFPLDRLPQGLAARDDAPIDAEVILGHSTRCETFLEDATNPGAV